ncbi:ABC transporter permease [Cellulosimicrobium sp. NPDC057127]|uniref:ABC transporter permease n=1 Tax=Cellulosimicrobium sp. NPDC057127 TaxID=3346026 RepID=UPI003636DEBC
MMGRIALRGVRAHRAQLVLSVLAVTIGVAFVTGTFALRAMLSSTFEDIVASSVQADVYLRGTVTASSPAGAPADGAAPADAVRALVPADLAATVASRDDVALALPEVSGPAVLVGADGTAVLSTQAPSFATAYDPRDPGPRVVDGRAPRGPGEVALESATLEASGLAVGDRTDVVLGDDVRPVDVVGEVSLSAPMAGATMVLLDQATASAAYAPDGLVPTVAVHAADGTSPQALRDALADAVPGGVEVVTGDALRAETSDAIAEQLGFVSTFLLVFAALALFVGTFLIANTFAMHVRRRTRELALLRAVGASPAQVFRSVVAQAAVVGAVGALLGVAAGFGLAELARTGLGAVGMELDGALPVTTAGIVVPLLVGVLVSVGAAALPARHAALVRPVEAMRQDAASGPGRTRPLRLLSGAAALLGGVALVVVAHATGSGAAPVLGAGAALTLAGVLLLAPVAVPPVLSVLAAPAAWLVRPLGGLARGNVTRQPRRTAATAGALVIGMTLVSATSVLAVSARESVHQIVDQETAADLVVRSATPNLPQGAADAVRAVPGVASTDVVTYGQVLVDDEPQLVVGFPADGFGRSVRTTATEGDLAAYARGEAAVMADAVDEHGWELGDTIALADPARPDAPPREVRIGAVIDSQAFSVDVLLPTEVAAQVGATTPEMVFLDVADDADPAVVHDRVTEAVAPFVVASVLDAQEFAGEVAAQVESVLAIVYALLGLSVLVAVLGIVNTLALSVVERTREIGLLRAVGLGRTQLAGTIVLESVLVAVFGTAVGLAVGTGVAAALPSVLADEGFSTLAVPWAQLAAMLGLAVVVGVAAAVWPAVRAARLPVLDAVSHA